MADRLKILRLQHSLVEPTNHPVLDELAKFPDIEVRAICPRWGIESGSKRVLAVDRPDITVGKTVLTFNYSTKVYLSRLLSLIRNWRPDVMDLHEEPWSLAAGQALLYRRLFSPESKVLGYSAQNILKNYPPPFAWIQNMTLRASAAYYVCSGSVREVIRRRGYKGRIDVVPLGIDPSGYKFVRHAGSLKANTLTVGFVGRMVEEKGIFMLIRAAAAIGQRIRVVFVGPGPDIERARRLAAALGIQNRTTFTGGLPYTDVIQLMSGFDVLAVPSQTTPTWKEQFGRVIVEAMNCGVPVIGADSGSIPEVIGDAGLIFPEKDERALVKCLQRLLDFPVHLSEMSELGYERAVGNYTWTRAAEKMRDLYRFAVGINP